MVKVWNGFGGWKGKQLLFGLGLGIMLWLFVLGLPGLSVQGAVLAQALPEPLVPYSPLQLDISYENVTLRLRRIDFWDGYIVLVGTATKQYGAACLSRREFTLQLGDIAYEPADREKTRPAYGVDAPGTGVFLDCLDSTKPELLLLPFVVPVTETTAQLTYQDQTVALPAPLATLRQGSQLPPPTVTFTPSRTPTPLATRTSTPIPTGTYTPAPVATIGGTPSAFSLPLPTAATSLFRSGTVSNQGIQFTLERIDLWERLPDDTRPDNDRFVILTGTLLPSGTGSNSCLGARDLQLRIGATRYAMDHMRSANQFYQSSYPGYLLPQCVWGNTPVTTFFVFDVEAANEPAVLSFYGATLQLDLSLRDPVIALAPTATSIPTQVPLTIPTTTGAPTLILQATAATPMTPILAYGVVNQNANLRAGPGTEFAIVGAASAGQSVEIIGSNSREDWLQLAKDTWIAAFLVNVALPPAATATTPVATPLLVPAATP